MGNNPSLCSNGRRKRRDAMTKVNLCMGSRKLTRSLAEQDFHDLEALIAERPQEVDEDIFQPLSTFLPFMVQEEIASRLMADRSVVSDDKSTQKVLVSKFEAVVVHCMTSGLQELVEAVSRDVDGVEKLGCALNSFFGIFIDHVISYGGDVVKICGDAITVMWPLGDQDGFQTLREAVLAACAFSIRALEDLGNFDAGSRFELSSSMQLTLQFTLGAGETLLLEVGGLNGKCEYVLAGAALCQIAAAKPLAGPGEKVLSSEAWQAAESLLVEETTNSTSSPSSECKRLHGLKVPDPFAGAGGRSDRKSVV